MNPFNMGRRSFVRGLPLAGAAAVLPTVAVAALVAEHPNDKVRRLAREIMQTLNDPAFLGFRQLTITPDLHTKEPAYAYCKKDIRAAIERWRGPWNNAAGNAAIDARIEKKVAEYWAIRAERDRLSRREWPDSGRDRARGGIRRRV
jgi:hypothetical protein